MVILYFNVISSTFTAVVSSRLEWIGIAASVVSENPARKPCSARMESPNAEMTSAPTDPITGAATMAIPPCSRYSAGSKTREENTHCCGDDRVDRKVTEPDTREQERHRVAPLEAGYH